MRKRCGIALGSNLGDRLGNLRSGVELLLARVPGVELISVAPMYETAPIDCAPGTQAFFNSVIEVACKMDPHALREVTAGIEQELGRPAVRERNAPRSLDLDLLYFGDQVVSDEVLELPHPRLADRRFVLEPLSAIRPDLLLPGQELTVAVLLSRLPADAGVVRVMDETWVAQGSEQG